MTPEITSGCDAGDNVMSFGTAYL